MESVMESVAKTITDVVLSAITDEIMDKSENNGGEITIFLRRFNVDTENEAYGKVIIKVAPIKKDDWDKILNEEPVLYNKGKGGNDK